MNRGMCPECGSNDVSIRAYDFGACPQTGYRDAGERFTCRTCGAEGDVGELDRASVLDVPEVVSAL